MAFSPGIDIGSDSIKWVSLRRAGDNSLSLAGYGRIPLKEGALTGNFNKLGLEIPEAFDNAVETAAKESGAVGAEAAVTFPDQYIKVFFVELDRLQDITSKEKTYTKWRIRQHLPASIISDCIIDYQHIATTKREGSPMFRLVVEAIREETINELASRINKERVWPSYFNSNCFCCFNLFHDHLLEKVQQETPLCLIHVGHYSTTFSFYRNGMLEYLRILDFAWVNFIANRMRILGENRETALRALAEQELIPTGNAKMASLSDLALFSETFEEWFREIETTFSYHKTNYPSVQPPVVFLAGGGACLRNLPSFLERLLNVPVTLLDPADVMDFDCDPQPGLNDRLSISACIGAVVSGSPHAGRKAPVAIGTKHPQQGGEQGR